MCRPLFVLPLLLALAACDASGPSQADIEAARSPDAEGVVVNRSSADFLVLAFDQELAARINFPGEVDDVDPDAIVRRGEAAPLHIGGYREGEAFVVYLYRIEGRRAWIDGGVVVEGPAFTADDGVVTVREF